MFNDVIELYFSEVLLFVRHTEEQGTLQRRNSAQNRCSSLFLSLSVAVLFLSNSEPITDQLVGEGGAQHSQFRTAIRV